MFKKWLCHFVQNGQFVPKNLVFCSEMDKLSQRIVGPIPKNLVSDWPFDQKWTHTKELVYWNKKIWSVTGHFSEMDNWHQGIGVPIPKHLVSNWPVFRNGQLTPNNWCTYTKNLVSNWSFVQKWTNCHVTKSNSTENKTSYLK